MQSCWKLPNESWRSIRIWNVCRRKDGIVNWREAWQAGRKPCLIHILSVLFTFMSPFWRLVSVTGFSLHVHNGKLVRRSPHFVSSHIENSYQSSVPASSHLEYHLDDAQRHMIPVSIHVWSICLIPTFCICFCNCFSSCVFLFGMTLQSTSKILKFLSYLRLSERHPGPRSNVM